jgi:hypothetical protein
LPSSTFQKHRSIGFVLRYCSSDYADPPEDTDIIKDLASVIVGEVPSSQQDEIRKELRKLLKDVGNLSADDFQSLALTVVHLRNSRLESNIHFVALP